MKIKHRTRTWPPFAGDSVVPALGDVVLGAQKCEGAKEHIELTLFDKNGTEYMALVQLPENVLEKAIMVIVANKNVTLLEVGELDIS